MYRSLRLLCLDRRYLQHCGLLGQLDDRTFRPGGPRMGRGSSPMQLNLHCLLPDLADPCRTLLRLRWLQYLLLKGRENEHQYRL